MVRAKKKIKGIEKGIFLLVERNRLRVNFRTPGNTFTSSKYFPNTAAGLQAARIFRAELALAKQTGELDNIRSQDLYLDDLARLYKADAEMRGASAKWIFEFSAIMNKHLLPRLCSSPVNSLAYADVMTAVAEAWPNVSLATRQRYLGYLKACFRFGIEHDLTSTNPLAKWKKRQEPARDWKLTVEDLGKILRHAAPHVVWAIQVAFELGPRPGETELFSLRFEDYDQDDRTFLIRGTKTAGSKRRVPVSDEFHVRLLEARTTSQSGYVIEYRGKPVKRFWKAFKAACARAGIEYPVRPYDVRHLYASDLLQSGADVATVSAMIGHKSISTTQRYYLHPLKGAMAEAIKRKSSVLATHNPAKVLKVDDR